jgi:uncharacterized protein (TIGR02271 family)
MAAKKQSKNMAKTKKASAQVAEMASGRSEEVVVPVAEEHLQVDKRPVVKGKLKLVKSVEERLESVTVPLQRETFQVKRVPINEVVSQPTGSRQEGDTLIIPVFEEFVVVEKRYRLVEEIHVVRSQTTRDEVQDVVVRRERVRLERDGEEVVIEEKA